MTAKGYSIVHISVTDPANYPKYLAADAPVLEKYGAKFSCGAGDMKPLRAKPVSGTSSSSSTRMRRRSLVITRKSIRTPPSCDRATRNPNC